MIDFDGTLNAAISSTLGDQVEVNYFLQPGVGIPVLAIFTLINDTQFDDDGAPNENIAVATLGLQVSQLPAPPVQGNTVVIDGTTYAVANVDQDGLGWAYLHLNLAG